MDPKRSRVLTKAEKELVTRRALAAYYADENESAWPDGRSSGVVRRGELNYVVLHDLEMALLAVYRLRHDDKLKRLTQLPEGLA